MAHPFRPSKPLRILTLDGGGLQAISTLLILERVLEKTAQENGQGSIKPRPCDVFDTIAGIGAGGWLAILLGRFRMDVDSCLSQWYNMMQLITPKSKTEELRMRLRRHCYYDTERLVGRVNHLTRIHGTGDRLLEPDINGTRTRHVFVAALTSDAKGYKIFRSYEIPEFAKLPEKLLEGPKNPANFKISHAFGVTGAARYFSNPWKAQMATSGETEFSDTKFPKPHNITGMALDEMWGIYGTDVPLSVVVNIGPGLPHDVDVKQIARRFSWVLNQSSVHGSFTRRALSPIFTISPSDNAEQEVLSETFHSDTAIGSVKSRDFDAELRRFEDDIEKDIRTKLDDTQPGDANIYYRLAPAKAPRGTPQNDSPTSVRALDDTMVYLSESRVGATIDNLVKRILKVESSC